MRVLCLHPSTSSAHKLHASLSPLEERLWTKHGIELVFIDAPLLDCTAADTTTGSDGNDEECWNNRQAASRRWYVQEEVRKERLLLPSTENAALLDTIDSETKSSNNNNNATTVQYSGLDASLLHITQIWSRGGANHKQNEGNSSTNNGGIEQCLPFQGILGIQQGADVAAMLPLLTTANTDNEEGRSLLEGLQFVILVDGRDIMSQDEEGTSGDAGGSEVELENEHATSNPQEEEDWYVGPNGIESLHVIADTKGNNDGSASNNRRNSELLAKRYGPNATIQYYKPSKKSSSSYNNSSNNNNNSSSQPYNHPNSPSLHNLLGKYLVHQKNKFHSSPHKRTYLQLQHQLSHVEQVASVMITEEVRRNPPRCLMAMIGPAAAAAEVVEGDVADDDCVENENGQFSNNSSNEEETTASSTSNTQVKAVVVGKTVGAWQGSGRVPGEQGGGAPCPETFLLRQEERKSNVVVGSS